MPSLPRAFARDTLKMNPYPVGLTCLVGVDYAIGFTLFPRGTNFPILLTSALATASICNQRFSRSGRHHDCVCVKCLIQVLSAYFQSDSAQHNR